MNKLKNEKIITTSNTNSEGDIVLNDDALLSLIQQFPFLYNYRVIPHGDPDYENWAWNHIAKSFNRTYGNALKEKNIEFTSKVLKDRWQILKDLILLIHKSHDVLSIPDKLRVNILRICAVLEDKTLIKRPKEMTPAQKLVLSKKDFVKKLSSNQQKRLEREIIELMLFHELNPRGYVYQKPPTNHEDVQQEMEKFLNKIGFNDDCALEKIQKIENKVNTEEPEGKIVASDIIDMTTDPPTVKGSNLKNIDKTLPPNKILDEEELIDEFEEFLEVSDDEIAENPKELQLFEADDKDVYNAYDIIKTEVKEIKEEEFGIINESEMETIIKAEPEDYTFNNNLQFMYDDDQPSTSHAIREYLNFKTQQM